MVELNIDGLVGPTHNYAGLSHGNIASQNNSGRVANPKAAALQGLSKMRRLIEMGLTQAVMPPQERPFLPQLRHLGFSGSDSAVIQEAMRQSPTLYANHCSASSMWAANAATVSPSADCQDGKVHVTPANLSAMLHRSIEADCTKRLLKLIFHNRDCFHVHDPLPAHPLYGDEGAANHNRLSASYCDTGLEIFIYGRKGLSSKTTAGFPARQTLEASQAIIRRHKLHSHNVILAQQNPIAINAGAFHNDVVCVTNGPVIMYHQDAFLNHAALQENIRHKADHLGFEPIFLEASRNDMPLSDAVSSYVFNSQIITLPDGNMALILPKEAENTPTSKQFVEKCVSDNGNPITQAHYLDLKQSMSNGGGPACLRLRVQLTPQELGAMHQPVLMTHEKIDRLELWVNRHYRDRLMFDDLADPAFLKETQTALDELTQILDMGAFYKFQNNSTRQWSDEHE